MADARPLTDEEIEAACKAVAPETKVSFKIQKFKTIMLPLHHFLSILGFHLSANHVSH